MRAGISVGAGSLHVLFVLGSNPLPWQLPAPQSLLQFVGRLLEIPVGLQWERARRPRPFPSALLCPSRAHRRLRVRSRSPPAGSSLPVAPTISAAAAASSTPASSCPSSYSDEPSSSLKSAEASPSHGTAELSVPAPRLLMRFGRSWLARARGCSPAPSSPRRFLHRWAARPRAFDSGWLLLRSACLRSRSSPLRLPHPLGLAPRG